MTEMTFDDLRALLIECAGEDESTPLGPESIDVEFDELGYDSLALMEVSARIGRTFGVVISEDDIVDLTTPRAVLDVVNRQAAVTA